MTNQNKTGFIIFDPAYTKMENSYNPGLHIVATFGTEKLQNIAAADVKDFFDKAIQQAGLNKVGEVYHSFPGGGFTAVICLTESHISIHTWPEHGLVTFDVFLSNFRNDNSEKARNIYEQTLRFFSATHADKQEINR